MYEANITGEHSGRLTGREVGTGYFLLAPDGTMRGTGYSILTTSTGETVLIEDRGMSVPLGPGRRRLRTTATFRTTSERLAWLNTTIGAFEAEVDVSKMELVGKNYEWKKVGKHPCSTLLKIFASNRRSKTATWCLPGSNVMS